MEERLNTNVKVVLGIRGEKGAIAVTGELNAFSQYCMLIGDRAPRATYSRGHWNLHESDSQTHGVGSFDSLPGWSEEDTRIERNLAWAVLWVYPFGQGFQAQHS